MNATPHLYLIGIGSNRRHIRHGRPQGVVEAAIARLDTDFMLFDASPILLNPAFGNAGRDFANAAAMIETPLAPRQMLSALKAIESDFGRKPGRRWGDRVLDLDILAWSGGRHHSQGLTIPHPAFADRPSAVIPAAAIAPNWPLPDGLRVRHLKERVGKRLAPR
ncbi:2-amino-4-hydroxy-6-hydroxymethyldihydropteridine diphosphokinase [Sphingomicrobium clamense]|uniref:2-amino-4-hydroxy-6-hydroxymethyldihydropteridine pyrophosphokinase n=1 Tax=Sphingomicrobium clamense TaxID=2851013 RepID=A0ABS6V5J9_9SPHN|nr:2-amino-4-hydroxy-6-hydroxymethyldihydropteridine diphosphokinase [Sphingomicrobium sp. B8]MBW0144846.1 2-amino-4-hydroxy-6-hydroxymethyldihydropteridine diphosphokinase [Sphingomicrobium sp. B8]